MSEAEIRDYLDQCKGIFKLIRRLAETPLPLEGDQLDQHEALTKLILESIREIKPPMPLGGSHAQLQWAFEAALRGLKAIRHGNDVIALDHLVEAFTMAAQSRSTLAQVLARERCPRRRNSTAGTL